MIASVLIVALAFGVTVVQAAGPIPWLDVVLAGKTDGRIVGGVEAVPHSFPWQVALQSRAGAATAWCGGSIINDQYVLTAGHCCDDDMPSSIKVRVGLHDLRSTAEVNAKTVSVARIIYHPAYNPSTLNSDFCLLKLSQRLTFSKEVQSVQLADTTDGPVEKKCIAIGWGRTSPIPGRKATNAGAPIILQSRLRQVEVTVIDNAECHKIYSTDSDPTDVPANMICARAPGKDACKADSGGPFVCQKTPGAPFKLVGVTSRGYGCADPKYPGVYGRTTSVLDWIASTFAA